MKECVVSSSDLKTSKNPKNSKRETIFYVLKKTTKNYIVVIILFCSLPGALFIIANSIYESRLLVEREHQIQLFFVTKVAEIQAETTESTRILLDGLARLTEVKEKDSELSQILLKSVHSLHPVYGTIHLVDLKGDLIASATATSPTNFSHTKHFKDVLSTKQFSTGQYLIGVTLSVPVFTFGAPVFDDQGDLVAVLLTSIKLDQYRQQFRKFSLPSESFLSIIDHNSNLIVSFSELTDEGESLNQTVFQAIEIVESEGLIEKARLNGRDYTLAYRQLSLSLDHEPYMYILIGVPTSVIERSAYASFWRNLIALITMFALAMWSGWYFGWRKIGLNLQKLSVVAGRVASGDLSTKIELSTDISELSDLKASFENMIDQLSRDRHIQESYVRTLELNEKTILNAYDATIAGWGFAVDLKDQETAKHSQRVTDLTLRLAKKLGIPDDMLDHVRRGALLHDIGKMGIPDSILFKAGPLNDEEWELMRKHPVYAYEMLSNIDYLKPAIDIPYSHHERWDGSGYPLGLKGEAIPLSARIFAIIDVYDALMSDRPYRKAWTHESTLAYIQRMREIHFDPQVVDAFLEEIESCFEDFQ